MVVDRWAKGSTIMASCNIEGFFRDYLNLICETTQNTSFKIIVIENGRVA
jgi:hypothetical protein